MQGRLGRSKGCDLQSHACRNRIFLNFMQLGKSLIPSHGELSLNFPVLPLLDSFTMGLPGSVPSLAFKPASSQVQFSSFSVHSFLAGDQNCLEVHSFSLNMHAYMHALMHTQACSHTCTHIHTRMHSCTHKHAHAIRTQHTHTLMHARALTHTHTHTCWKDLSVTNSAFFVTYFRHKGILLQQLYFSD